MTMIELTKEHLSTSCCKKLKNILVGICSSYKATGMYRLQTVKV